MESYAEIYSQVETTSSRSRTKGCCGIWIFQTDSKHWITGWCVSLNSCKKAFCAFFRVVLGTIEMTLSWSSSRNIFVNWEVFPVPHSELMIRLSIALKSIYRSRYWECYTCKFLLKIGSFMIYLRLSLLFLTIYPCISNIFFKISNKSLTVCTGK